MKDFAQTYHTGIDPARSAAVTGLIAGSRIRTEHGERAIETLQPGERLIARNGKLATIEGLDVVDGATDAAVVIPKGALGNGLPRRTVVVGADQQLVLDWPSLEMLFDCASALVTARQLVGHGDIAFSDNARDVHYVSPRFQDSAVIFCSGMASWFGQDATRPTPPVLACAQVATLLKEGAPRSN